MHCFLTVHVKYLFLFFIYLFGRYFADEVKAGRHGLDFFQRFAVTETSKFNVLTFCFVVILFVDMF